MHALKNSTLYCILFCSCCLLLWACENDIKQVQALGSKKIGVDTIIGAEAYLSQDAKVKAKLTAPLMLRTFTDTVKTEFPKTLHVVFFNDSLKAESQVYAKYGRYLENDSKVFLRDSVIVFNVKGDTLKTEDLYWDRTKQLFYTDKHVTILRAGDLPLYGTGLTAKQDFTNYHITNPTGFISVADSTLP